jgi:hypothetical protein
VLYIPIVSLVACGGDRNLIPRADVVADMPNARDTYQPPFDVPTPTDVPVRRDMPTPQDSPAEMDAADGTAATADASGDMPTPDAAASDGATDVPSSDAQSLARCSPTVDGTLDAVEWRAGYFAQNTVLPSIWGPNELRELRMCFDDSALYIGVRGTVESGGGAGAVANAIVLYVDRDYVGPGGMPATGISLLSALSDRVGVLDSALSAGLTLGLGTEGFGVEAAWGIAGMRAVNSATSLDDFGWRLFWPAGGNPDRRRDFAFVLGGVNTACQDRPGTADDACETRILWSSLFEGPRPARTTVAVFARIVNGDGSMSPNQTLPQDDPMMPRTVHRVGVIEVR